MILFFQWNQINCHSVTRFETKNRQPKPHTLSFAFCKQAVKIKIIYWRQMFGQLWNKRLAGGRHLFSETTTERRKLVIAQVAFLFQSDHRVVTPEHCWKVLTCTNGQWPHLLKSNSSGYILLPPRLALSPASRFFDETIITNFEAIWLSTSIKTKFPSIPRPPNLSS